MQRQAWLYELGDCDLRLSNLGVQKIDEKTFEQKFEVPTVQDLLNDPLSKYITLAANDCEYKGSTHKLIVNTIHPLFLEAKVAVSRAGNPT